ncbi:ALTO [Bovine polyomavirus 2a]|nr:ALTO [Bovine polyomavirus 2a]APA20884.1 ALTO [Bovine polyomavirus 2a]
MNLSTGPLSLKPGGISSMAVISLSLSPRPNQPVEDPPADLAEPPRQTPQPQPLPQAPVYLPQNLVSGQMWERLGAKPRLQRQARLLEEAEPPGEEEPEYLEVLPIPESSGQNHKTRICTATRPWDPHLNPRERMTVPPPVPPSPPPQHPRNRERCLREQLEREHLMMEIVVQDLQEHLTLLHQRQKRMRVSIILLIFLAACLIISLTLCIAIKQ